MQKEEELDYSLYAPCSPYPFDENDNVLGYHIDNTKLKCYFNSNGNLLIDNVSYVEQCGQYYYIDNGIYDKNLNKLIHIGRGKFNDMAYVGLFNDGILLESLSENKFHIYSFEAEDFIRSFTLEEVTTPHHTSIIYSKYIMKNMTLYDLHGSKISDDVYTVYRNSYMKKVGTKKLQLLTYDNDIIIEEADSIYVNSKYYGYSIGTACYVYKIDNNVKLFEIDKGFKVANILNDNVYILLKDNNYMMIKDGVPIKKMSIGEYGGFLTNSKLIFKYNHKLYNINNNLTLDLPKGYMAEHINDIVYIFNKERVLTFNMDFELIKEHKMSEYLYNVTRLENRNKKLKQLGVI